MLFRMRTPEPVRRFDDAVDRAFEPLRTIPVINRTAYLASESAHNSVLWHVIGITMAIVRPDLRGRAVRMAVTLGIESILVNGIIKPLIGRERPGNWEVDEHQARRPKTSSFPSGHASSAVVAATMLHDAVPRGRVVWWGLALGVATSRIHTRMHHASDVLAGAAIGRVIGKKALSAPIPRRTPRQRPADNVAGWRSFLHTELAGDSHE